MSEQGLLIVLGGLLVGFISLAVIALLAWAGNKVYKLMAEIRDGMKELRVTAEKLTSQSSALESLPAVIKDFSKYTEGHTLAAIKHAAAVEAFTKGVQLFSKNLFRTDESQNTFKVPTEAEVSQEFDLQEILRGNPNMSIEAAKAQVSNMGTE